MEDLCYLQSEKISVVVLKINTFLQKKLPLALDCRQSKYFLQIYNIHIFSIFDVVSAVPFPKAPASCGKKILK